MADHKLTEDEKVLHGMGYAQELSRRMGAFQNFAISFAIICIVAGGITAFPVALSAGGGVDRRHLAGRQLFALVVPSQWGRSPRPFRRRAAYTIGRRSSVAAVSAGRRPGSICWA